MTEVDIKREQLGEKEVSGKEAKRPDHHKRQMEKEKEGKGNMEKGRQGGHWRKRGGELSEHPILEEGSLGVGDDGEEIVRRHGRW